MSFNLTDLQPHDNPRIDRLTGRERLRWVLDFLRHNLDALSQGERTALGDDLRHATAPAWVQKYGCTCMPAADVRVLQAEIRAGIHTLLADALDMLEMMHIHRGQPPVHAAWQLPEAPTYLVRLRMDRDGHHTRVVCLSQGTTDREAILAGVAGLLSTYGDRLCACPVCGTPFLRQSRQAYCTVRCSNKVRNRRRLERKAQQVAV